MTEWPPRIRYDQRKVPRRLESWQFTRDGPFWGAFVAMLVWLSVFGYIVVQIILEQPSR